MQRDDGKPDAERFVQSAYDKDAVLAELARIAFANPLDYLRIEPDGLCRIDLSNLDRDKAAAIDEIIVDHAEGRDGVTRVKRVRLKMADKRGALVDLGKHQGLFNERKTREQNERNMSDEELGRRIAVVNAQAKAAGIDIGELADDRSGPGSDSEEEGR